MRDAMALKARKAFGLCILERDLGCAPDACPTHFVSSDLKQQKTRSPGPGSYSHDGHAHDKIMPIQKKNK